jgi:hypothetical protein
MLLCVAKLVERYVPADRLETELADLGAVTAQLAGGAMRPRGLAQER